MRTSYSLEDLSDADKQELRALHATFIAAPRSMSQARLVDFIKQELEKRHVVFGVAEEAYVDGFEGQAQFQMLPPAQVMPLADKINQAGLPHKLIVLPYAQADVDDVIRLVRPNNVVLVRGSWHLVFHRRSTYALLVKRGIPFSFVSPFLHEQEAKDYLSAVKPKGQSFRKQRGDRAAMLALAAEVARQSYDYSFQTGAVLAESIGDAYTVVDAACNEVVPYQTYALHFGNSREDNLSPAHDANHYDTIHAEMNLLVRALKNGRNFEGKTLFINMLPCPSCARTLVKTGLTEVVYHEVHSDGYAVKLFEHAGIKTRKADI